MEEKVGVLDSSRIPFEFLMILFLFHLLRHPLNCPICPRPSSESSGLEDEGTFMVEDSPRRGSAPAASTLDESPSSRSEQLIQKYRHSVDVSADILRSIEEVGVRRCLGREVIIHSFFYLLVYSFIYFVCVWRMFCFLTVELYGDF